MSDVTKLKSRMGDMVCDLLGEVNSLKKQLDGLDSFSFNTAMTLIQEKENTLERLGKILKEFA